MKRWWVRAMFILSGGDNVYSDVSVAASSMEVALVKGTQEGRKQSVPKGRKVTEIRARVEPIERRPQEEPQC
jgi:hypothetical protein